MIHSEENAIKATTWVIVPAYNEEHAVGGVVRALRLEGWRTVVVDDGSTDETAAVAARHGAVVLRHAVNVGQGAALRTGFAFVLGLPSARHVVTFDADGQHSIADLPEVVTPLARGDADVVLGSRFLGASSLNQVPPVRRLALRAGAAMARRSTGLALTDTHNGFRGFTTSALRRLELHQDRMAHASELLLEIARTRCRVTEVPVQVIYTAYSLRKGQRLIDAVSILWDQAISRLR